MTKLSLEKMLWIAIDSSRTFLLNIICKAALVFFINSELGFRLTQYKFGYRDDLINV